MNIEVAQLALKDVDFKISNPLEPLTQRLRTTLDMQ
jgi:hypothetical protein